MSKNVIKELQQYLFEQMKFAGVTMQVASEYLGYAHKSSVSRALAKHRMSARDAIKLLALISIRTVNVSRFSIEINIASTDNTVRMKVCENLFSLLQEEVFEKGFTRKILLNNVTWNDIAHEADYNDGESARRAWFDLDTPLYLVFTVLKSIGQQEITGTNGVDRLTISLKAKKVAGPLPNDQIFSN